MMRFVQKIAVKLVLCVLCGTVGLTASVVNAAPTSRRAKVVPSVAFLLDKLKQQHWRARFDASMALAKRGATQRWKAFGAQAKVVEKALVGLLSQDKNFWVRAGAAKALGQLGDRGVLSLVKAAQGDKQSEVRNAAAKALGTMASSGRTPVLGGHFGVVVAAMNKALKDKAIRWTAARTLESLTGNPQPLVSIMMAELKRRKGPLQGIVAISFGKLTARGKNYATQMLIEALGTQPAEAHASLVRALQAIGKQAIPALVLAKKHKLQAVRTSATKALQLIKKP